MMLANDIPEEIGYNYVLASRVGYELCGWLMAFLKKLDACGGQ